MYSRKLMFFSERTVRKFELLGTRRDEYRKTVIARLMLLSV
jgi:hypothetical protein